MKDKNNKLKIILGSQSKGRKKVLEKLGYDFDILTADIDEKSIRDKDPKKLTSKLANAKADVLIGKIKYPALLITADQVVYCNGKIIEKPETAKEVEKFWESYVKFPAQAINTVVITNTKTGQRIEESDINTIYFKKIPPAKIKKLIKQGEVFNQAGGFSIWDPIVKPYILKIEGEEESIMGLPAKLTNKLLSKLNNEN